MSNTFDDMPFKSEITDYWDYHSGINDNAWIGCINGKTFNGGNNCIVGTENFASIKNSFSANFGNIYATTVYIIAQLNVNTALSDWHTIYGAYGTAPEFNLCNYNGCFAIGTGSSSGVYTSNIKTYNEWHICTLVQNNGYGALYIDGKLLYSYSNYYYPVGQNNMYLNGDGYTLNTKMIGIFNGTAHTSEQISRYVEWLKIQYGFKPPEKSSRLAGTDAVAIAYAIARNQESAAALQEMKKAYREGLIEGDNGSGEVIEPYETTDPVIDIPTGEDDKITEPACIDLTRGGLWLKYQNPEDETDIRTVKIYLTEDTVGVNGGYDSFYGNHYIAVDIFDKDNQLIKTLYMLGNDGNKQWYYEKAMTYDKLYYITITDKIHVYASGFVNRDYSMYFYNPSGENHYYYKHDINFSPYISGYTYISCGNIKPE